MYIIIIIITTPEERIKVEVDITDMYLHIKKEYREKNE